MPAVGATDTSDHHDVVALLVACGVEPVVANRYVASATKNPEAGTFWEVYGKGNLANAARRERDISVVGLRVLDLRSSRPDGEHWDFTRKTDRRWAMKLVETEDPTWIIGAPPCTAFSNLNFGLNYPKMAPEEVEKRWKEGMIHMHFICRLYRR